MDVRINDITGMAVLLGNNGAEKSTFFDVFGFLHDCLMTNVSAVMLKRGGFEEVRSRYQSGDIAFVIQFRPNEDEPLIAYEVSFGIGERNKVIVKDEYLRMRRGQYGVPWKILVFHCGEGLAAEGELRTNEDVQLATKTKRRLEFQDVLAIKGLGYLTNFVAVNQFRKLIEDWYVADFRIDLARGRQEENYSERLS